jgi:anti-anti-sigma regulatory factor
MNPLAVPSSAPSTPEASVSAGETLTIYTVEACASAWRDALRDAGGLSLDLSAVRACDTLGVQLLAALQRTATAAAKPLRFHQPSEAVTVAAEAVGCSALLFANSANSSCAPSSP